jgi:hypothetical protein
MICSVSGISNMSDNKLMIQINDDADGRCFNLNLSELSAAQLLLYINALQKEYDSRRSSTLSVLVPPGPNSSQN